MRQENISPLLVQAICNQPEDRRPPQNIMEQKLVDIFEPMRLDLVDIILNSPAGNNICQPTRDAMARKLPHFFI